MSKSSRPWGATGAGHLPPFFLADDDKDHLREVLDLRHIAIDEPSLFSDLTQAVRFYLGAKLLGRKSSPATTRADFRALRNAALKVNKVLNSTGGNTKMIMSEVGGEDGYLGLHALVGRIMRVANLGLEEAQNYPAAGPLIDDPAVDLCLNVARALQTHCGIKPTTTKESKLEGSVAIILEAASGKEVSACHELIRRSLSPKNAGRPHLIPS